MVTINYQLIDTFENYKEFETVAQAIEWIQGIGEDMFQYVDLTDDKENYVSGFSDIIETYKKNNDLWQGSPACIHLNVGSGHGGWCRV
ncbi:hypothetical protein OXC43_gp82 [Klebsiella phage vB_KpP_FBKp27]|uniref:Uncharacterized protein n=1 Tax=Klebsiella phage vB_KpP_FBKp27 TaxID=2801837 RepID=A0A7U0J503_9CAUD|nr:hypothetical protein OXC43_gp82 [Klebsiella phage vB_KpP_FBKp27]QQV91664.1 hypothetical protein vBKpPFBKp27_037 [Klebsiella phage vB_KpP_FBKp27]